MKLVGIGIIIFLFCGAFLLLNLPHKGERFEIYGFKLIDGTEIQAQAFYEERIFLNILPGAFYEFKVKIAGSAEFIKIMEFRHDDHVPIPKEQILELHPKLLVVFIGWKLAISSDNGNTWRGWDASKDLPNWDCCNYGLISEIKMEKDGEIIVQLNPINNRTSGIRTLHSQNYGNSWKTIKLD